MPTERTETISTSDGGTYDGWLFVPDRGFGPGILLLQEIFGVGSFLRAKAIDLAERGYVVLCPDVFTDSPMELWRSVLARQPGDLARVARVPTNPRLN